jgi:CRISPR-associated protein Cmr6
MPSKNDVPLMYRAQMEGRCQLHRIYRPKDLTEIQKQEGLKEPQQYSERWVNQWLEVQPNVENRTNYPLDISTNEPQSFINQDSKSHVQINPLNNNNHEQTTNQYYQTHKYQISWRFVINGGKDDGIIRPLIGAFGLPFYPGSSMKGAFREACQREETAKRLPPGTGDRYCGTSTTNSDDDNSQPGILRFHGGYPINHNWHKNLVDIVHPQQDFQVKENAPHSAYTLISLHQPEIEFTISTTNQEETSAAYPHY